MLAEERVRRLDAVGFCWDRRLTNAGTIEAAWKQRFKELKSFKKEHGHCNVPVRYPPNPVLGRWVMSVRQCKNRRRSCSG